MRLSLPTSLRRPLNVALLLSVGAHLLMGYGLGVSWQRSRVAAAAVPETPPRQIQFELVETPESAETEAAARDPRFLSNRNTRSQQPTPPDDDRPINRRPQTLGDGESHDLRPAGSAPQLGLPSPPAAAAPSPAVPETPAAEAPEPQENAVRVEPRPRLQVPVPAADQEERQRHEPRRPAPRPAPPAPQRRPQVPTSPTLRDTVSPGRPLTEVEADELARAEAEGAFSYEATRHFFADYFFDLKDKIESTWLLLLMGRYSNVGPGKVSIDFKVYPDGSIGDLRIGPAEGDQIFPLVSGMAIRNAAPFGPVPYDSLPQLPPAVRELPLSIRINFNYKTE